MSGSFDDIDGVALGHATDPAARTGCTALVFRRGAAAAVHVPGSATGTRELGVLSPGALARQVHALVLSGGSAFGLATAHGVMEVLAERGIGHAVGDHVVPIVPAAILFDLSVARRRPTAADGRVAAEAALAGEGHAGDGAIGAGTGATVGVASGLPAPGGLGVCAESVGPWMVGAVVACNAVGSVRDTGGRWIAGGVPRGSVPGTPGAHTTLVAVVSDAAVDREQAAVVAKMAAAGLARALVPAFLPFDGDVVFAAGTAAVPDEVGPEALAGIGHAAATCVAEALRRGVRAAQGTRTTGQ